MQPLPEKVRAFGLKQKCKTRFKNKVDGVLEFFYLNKLRERERKKKVSS